MKTLLYLPLCLLLGCSSLPDLKTVLSDLPPLPKSFTFTVTTPTNLVSGRVIPGAAAAGVTYAPSPARIAPVKTAVYNAITHETNVVDALVFTVPNPTKKAFAVYNSVGLTDWTSVWFGSTSDPILFYDFSYQSTPHQFYKFLVAQP